MSFLLFMLVLGIMIAVHEAGHFCAARLCGVQVEVFSIGFGRPLFTKKFKTFEFRIGSIPFGGYVKLFGDDPKESTGHKDEFLKQPKRKRAFIVAAGPLFNYLLAWLLFCGVFAVGFSVPSPKIGTVLEGYPAEAVGLQQGDLIRQVNGHEITAWNDVVERIQGADGARLDILVDRNGAERTFVIDPQNRERTDVFGKKKPVSFIGVAPSEELMMLQYSIPEAFAKGTEALFRFTILTLQGLWYMIIGVLPFKESVTGPLGIYFITKQAMEIGLGAIMHLMAVISMSLGIFNLLPLPVLDGGHLFFIGVETLRGRPLSDRVQDRITQVGFALIMVLMAFVLINDVQRYWPHSQPVQQSDDFGDMLAGSDTEGGHATE